MISAELWIARASVTRACVEGNDHSTTSGRTQPYLLATTVQREINQMLTSILQDISPQCQSLLAQFGIVTSLE